MAPKWSIVVVLAISCSIMALEHPKSPSKRAIDANFQRRYNRLQHGLRNNPLAFSYIKYFLRNRAQKRERRQANYYSNNYPSANRYDYNPGYNAYSRYDQTQRLRQSNYSPTQFVRYNQQSLVRQRQVPSTTSKPPSKKAGKRPFRPPMVFFRR